jgi:hypothetical protein
MGVTVNIKNIIVVIPIFIAVFKATLIGLVVSLLARKYFPQRTEVLKKTTNDAVPQDE